MRDVALYLFIAFIVVPVLEIYLITEVAGQLGWLETIVLVIAVSLVGAWLVKREGLSVIRRVQTAFQSGRLPTNELADGGMIFFASALMLTPGFLTDALGLALLIPPIRALLRPAVIGFFRRRVEVRTSSMGPVFRRPPGFGRTVYDVDATADADIVDVTDLSDRPDNRELD